MENYLKKEMCVQENVTEAILIKPHKEIKAKMV
jgi:hypothetical protein